MKEHKSFRASDFSMRDVSWLVPGYFIIAVIMVCIGLLLEVIPEFWRGFLLGGGAAWIGFYYLFVPRQKKIDVTALPQPSETVRAKCEDPNCPLAVAVKAYRDETGLGLSEAKTLVDSYRARKRPSDQEAL